jgi:hypothetical protein
MRKGIEFFAAAHSNSKKVKYFGLEIWKEGKHQ